MDDTKIVVSVIGLGYVGLPLAVAIGKKFKTIGYDLNAERVALLQRGVDRNNETTTEDLVTSNVHFTANESHLKEANFHVIAVPTPIDHANRPDLTPIIGASRAVGRSLKKGDIVVYESTVYPGLTEEECLPILEKESGLVAGIDFKIGYSPERINPGDREHTFTKIVKVVSAQDKQSLDVVAHVYGSVVTAGIHRASSIKVAEMAKVIENTQRDLNIALMNELSIICDRMEIDTKEVLEAAGTKWNFLKFSPGLVGGHCIGVDPYYLTHKAETLGYHPQVILAGRRINDGMGKFIASRTIKEMVRAGHDLCKSKITVLGLTFKENCPDLRNSKVIDIVRELNEYGIPVQVHDPMVDPKEVKHEYGIDVVSRDQLEPASALIVAVAHDCFKKMPLDEIGSLMRDCPVLCDVKGIFNASILRESGIKVWRL
jgi:UDP-N-acetyl-D-galactosamine dehydrogenase